jgi:hexosaminidase
MPTETAYRLFSNWDSAARVIELTLVAGEGGAPLEGARLATTSLFRIHPECEIEGATLADQLSNYHVFAQPAGARLGPGERWTIRADRVSHVLRHYTYGPKSAFLILADNTVRPVEVEAMTRDGAAGAPAWEKLAARPLPDGAAPISVIPAPLHVEVSGRRDPALPLGLAAGAPDAARYAFIVVQRLSARLFDGETPLLARDAGHAVTVVADAELADGGYRIDFGEDRIVLAAGGENGFRHGFITLAQMLRGARLRPDAFVFPAIGTIADQPRFGWRGAHLDVARQFYPVRDLTAFLDCLAWNKLNRFHIHLNDDEAWRIEVPGYPALAAKAAWRGHGELVPPLLGAPAATTGGFYTSSDIREVVAHGASLGIEAVPEIDIPGHCHCVLEALPELRDPAESGMYRSIQYFPNNALNPAVAATWDFLAAVFDRLVELFPGHYIHAGADEVAEGSWMGSPLAVALGEELFGKAETFTLQSHFLKRVQAMLAERGRGIAAWQEAALGGGVSPDDALLVAWKNSESGLKLAEQGYRVVLAPAERYYFDIARSTEWWEPGASWAGTVTVEDTYSYDPGSDWPDALKGRIAGVQSCLWSENLSVPGLFEHLVYPRLSAMAEGAWCAPARKDFARFLAIQDLMPTSAKTDV